LSRIDRLKTQKSEKISPIEIAIESLLRDLIIFIRTHHFELITARSLSSLFSIFHTDGIRIAEYNIKKALRLICDVQTAVI